MDTDPSGWELLGGALQAEVEDFDPAVWEQLEVLATRIKEADITPELLSRLEQQTV
jgi:hypothetical protein